MAESIVLKLASSLGDMFSFGGKDVVGIDIGLSAVKVAQLQPQKKDNFKLTNYASVPLSEASLIEDEIQKDEEIVEAINMALKKARIGSKVACIGLFGPNTLAKKLQLAGGTFEEIEDQVMWEAEQYLPFSIDDATLSFHVLGENESGGVDVMIAAAKNDVIANYRQLVETAKLKVKVIDLQIIACANVFELVMGDHINQEDTSFVLINFGAQKSEFIIYKNGAINFCKEINIGGAMITEEIQRQMGVNYEQAEDLKITTDKGGNLPEEVLEIIDDVLEAFLGEIKKSIEFYRSSLSDDQFDQCFVTGGGALTSGLLEGLETLLEIDVSLLNPFDRMQYDKRRFTGELLDEITYCGVTAMGLAMRKVKK